MKLCLFLFSFILFSSSAGWAEEMNRDLQRRARPLRYECSSIVTTWLFDKIFRGARQVSYPSSDLNQGDILLVNVEVCADTCGDVIHPPDGPSNNTEPDIIGGMSLIEGITGEDTRVVNGGYFFLDSSGSAAGTIAFQGAVPEQGVVPEVFNETEGFNLPITGGTGEYAGATGYIFVDRIREIQVPDGQTPSRTTTMNVCVPRLPF